MSKGFGCGRGIGIEQRYSQIQVRGSEFWIEGDGLAIFRDGFRILLQAGVCKTQLEMRHGFAGSCRSDFLKQGNGSGKIVAVERALSLSEQRRQRICRGRRSLLWL